MSWLKKYFKLPSLEISPEREQEIIEKIANAIVKYGLSLPTLFVGPAFVPTSTIFSHVVLVPASPFLEMLGIDMNEYIAFFYKKDNVWRILDRVDDLKNAKEEAERQKKSNPQ